MHACHKIDVHAKQSKYPHEMLPTPALLVVHPVSQTQIWLAYNPFSFDLRGTLTFVCQNHPEAATLLYITTVTPHVPDGGRNPRGTVDCYGDRVRTVNPLRTTREQRSNFQV